MKRTDEEEELHSHIKALSSELECLYEERKERELECDLDFLRKEISELCREIIRKTNKHNE